MKDYIKEIELLLSIDENTMETVKSIEQAKKEIQTTVDSLTDIVLILDEQGNIIRSNQAMSKWHLGHTSEIKGLPYHRLFHSGCADQKCHMLTYWPLARAKLFNNETFEYQFFDKQLGKYLLMQFRPIPPQIAKEKGFEKNFAVATFKDITRNKQAEMQLGQTTEELRTIFQALPDQYIRLNQIGIIQDIRMNEKSSESILPMHAIGTLFTDYFPEETAEQFREAIQKVMRIGSLVIVEYSMIVDKIEQFFEARLLPLQKDHIMVINRNVTETKRFQSIAESVDFMKNLGYIFSGIRHEIGNPINAIKMTMSVLKKNIHQFPQEKILEYTERVLSEIHRVEYLLKSFKNFNMYENLETEKVQLSEFMKDFISILTRDIKDKGIQISCSCPPGEDIVMADPRALHQILLNIIGNSVDALKGITNPTIDVSTSKVDEKMLITITDNGKGINKEGLENLFKPFYTTKAEGNGLGLVIVKKILSRQKGNLSVRSELGKGTTVVITLPC